MIRLNFWWARLVLAFVLLMSVFLPSCTLMQGLGSAESTNEAWVIEWHREGGIVGFCDDVTIYATGLATVTSCRVEPPAVVGEATLTAEELAEIDLWQTTYASWTFDESDPAVADAMSIHFEFVGTGDQSLDEVTIQAINALAQALLGRAN